MRILILLASLLSAAIGLALAGVEPPGFLARHLLPVASLLGSLTGGGPATQPAPGPASTGLGVKPSGTVVGLARVIDGDTLDLAGQRIRLHGIDAPERRQICQRRGQAYDCGREARRWLEGAVTGREIRCDGRDRDRHGRLVAVCRAGGTDLGEGMVRAGWAIAYRRYSRAYAGVEDEARSGARGLWAGRFDPPERWRRMQDGR